MATDLPDQPESREESYLADIAGQDVELPEKPLSRKEQYLAYIAENGGGGGGSDGIKTLTTADYNYPTNNPIGVATWKLETGIYKTDGNVTVYPHTATAITPSQYELLFVSGKNAYVYTLRYNGAQTMALFSADRTTGVGQDEGSIFSNSLVVDNLTSTSTKRPLSANQGKALKDLIDGLIVSGAGAPTTSTVGTVGQLYEDTTNGKLYQCTSISGVTYTWSEVGGGGGVTPVQTTGTSATDVMSQKAVTDELYPQYSAHANRVIGIGNYNSIVNYGDSKVGIGSVNLGAQSAYSLAINGGSDVGTVNAISGMGIWAGSGGSVTGQSGIAIGTSASVSGKGSVAIGRNSSATSQGEFNIGSSDSDYGYNNTNYRLITGVHDGQGAHDAATVGQLNARIIQNAGAPTTATVGTLGQLLEDTSNGKLYQCTAVSGNTYTWTEVGSGGGGGSSSVILYSDFNNIPGPGVPSYDVSMFKDPALTMPYSVSEVVTALENNYQLIYCAVNGVDEFTAYNFTNVYLSGMSSPSNRTFDGEVLTYHNLGYGVLMINGDVAANEFNLSFSDLAQQ